MRHHNDGPQLQCHAEIFRLLKDVRGNWHNTVHLIVLGRRPGEEASHLAEPLKGSRKTAGTSQQTIHLHGEFSKTDETLL
jgi:hypothetical protein